MTLHRAAQWMRRATAASESTVPQPLGSHQPKAASLCIIEGSRLKLRSVHVYHHVDAGCSRSTPCAWNKIGSQGKGKTDGPGRVNNSGCHTVSRTARPPQRGWMLTPPFRPSRLLRHSRARTHTHANRTINPFVASMMAY